jgi:type II secretory pathway pseudopilin PulG
MRSKQSMTSPPDHLTAIPDPRAETIAATRRCRDSRGFTLLEVTIAATLVLLLAWLVATLSIDGMRAQKFAERQSRSSEITQDILDEMQRGLGSSVGLFGGGPIGEGYRAALIDGTLPPAIPSSRIPTVTPGGRLERETGPGVRTGNELFFTRYAWTDEFQTSTGVTHRVDIYRIERYYLTAVNGGPRRGSPDGLNLAHWVSEPLADGNQIDRITNGVERTEMLLHLLQRTPDTAGVVHDQVSLVWAGYLPIQDLGTLREIDAGGALLTSPSPARGGTEWRIRPELRLCDADMLVYRHHSVATNFAQNGTGVGRFSVPTAVNLGFPHGFEVQIIGPPSARQILLHLTVVSTNRNGQRAYADLQTIVDSRDP